MFSRFLVCGQLYKCEGFTLDSKLYSIRFTAKRIQIMAMVLKQSKSCRFCYSSVAMVGRCAFPFLVQEHKYNYYVYLHTVYSDSTYLTQFD